MKNKKVSIVRRLMNGVRLLLLYNEKCSTHFEIYCGNKRSSKSFLIYILQYSTNIVTVINTFMKNSKNLHGIVVNTNYNQHAALRKFRC